ncbi:MAG: bifunctional histidinol-phosphatase/imidazoleglycerol-phosphate dehydratase HisB [Bacteroidales bacterium]
MKKALFIDRDGTLIVEPPIDYQVDSFEKLKFIPGVIRNLHFIRTKLDYELVMVTNQDGLGTPGFPESDFIGPHSLMMDIFNGEGVVFDDVIIDKTFPEENAPTRKPGTALLNHYLSGEYDLEHSFVIGDRLTDVRLAANMGCKAILFQPEQVGKQMLESEGLTPYCALITEDWDRITEFLFAGERRACVKRKTSETDIIVEVNLDGCGEGDIQTGLGFFDHMLDQIARHSGMDLYIRTNGDLSVDEHHTIEDTALALGEALHLALGNKRGIERYGFSLPMDDCLCSVTLDFGGRSWLVWNANFQREKIGDMPTEMFLHFFKSLSDTAKMNLNIQAEGANEHHKIEGIFKALARAIRMAIRRDIYHYQLPSSKGTL